jgi:TPR repeat protein
MTHRCMCILAFVAAAFSAAAPAWSGYDEGVQAYSNGDFERAAREFMTLAKKGEAESQYMLGILYEEGQGLPRDDVEAAFWYARAANQGFVDAYFALGQLFVHRKGDRQDRMAAHHWFSLAKEYGHRLGEQEMLRNLNAMPPEMAEIARNRFRDRRLAVAR